MGEIPKFKKEDPSCREAMLLIAQIEDAASQMPERAEDFTDSILEKASSIKQYVEKAKRASPAQISALENMLSGLEKWIHY